jgi:hypothetical protein
MVQIADNKKQQLLGLIERIELINAQIDIHKEYDSSDDFMVRQYNFRKNRLLEQLQTLLEGFNIRVEVKLAA